MPLHVGVFVVMEDHNRAVFAYTAITITNFMRIRGGGKVEPNWMHSPSFFGCRWLKRYVYVVRNNICTSKNRIIVVVKVHQRWIVVHLFFLVVKKRCVMRERGVILHIERL